MALKNLFENLFSAWGNKFVKEHGTIAESWISDDGASWYRKYSDGWLEQGGVDSQTVSSSVKSITLNFPRAFASSDYLLLSQICVSTGTSQATVRQVSAATSRTATGFVYILGTNQSSPLRSWYAAGF